MFLQLVWHVAQLWWRVRFAWSSCTVAEVWGVLDCAVSVAASCNVHIIQHIMNLGHVHFHHNATQSGSCVMIVLAHLH